MPTAPRDILITYGILAMGGPSTTRQVHDKFTVQFTPRSFVVEFQLLVTGTTDAAFTTEVNAVEDAIRTPFQDLRIIFNSVLQYDLAESVRRGLNTRGQITKREDLLGTRLARMYTVRFEGDLPADQSAGQPSGLAGWREATVQVVFDSSRRRRVTLSGEWTATPTPSQGARAAYESVSSGIDAYASSVLTALDPAAVWQIEDENFDLDDHDLDTLSQGSVLRFNRIYAELLFETAGTPLTAGVQSGAPVTRQVLRISRDRTDFGSSPGTRRLLTATATYDAWVDKNVVSGSSGGTNTGGGLENLWDNTIRNFILDRIRSSGILAGAIAVVTERPNFEFDENRISAVLTVQGGPGTVLERRLALEESEIGGIVAVPVWDGDLRSRFVFNSPVEHRRTLVETSTIRSSRIIQPVAALGDELIGGRVIERHSSTTPLRLGTPEAGGTFDIVEVTGRIVVIVFNLSDGTRLTRTAAAAPAAVVAPFIFDFSDSIFQGVGRGMAEGFGQADIGGIVPPINQAPLGDIFG